MTTFPSEPVRTVRAHVRSFWSERTRGPHQRHLLDVQTLDGKEFILATFNPWKASLCQRARDLDLVVEIDWRLSKYFEGDLCAIRLPNLDAA